MTNTSSFAASERRPIVPGEGLLKPFFLAMIALLLLNDHVLKAAFPGFLTSKLSDFAGLAFFPVLLQALWEFGELAVCGRLARRRSVLLAAIALTAVGFVWIKLFPAGAEFYRSVGGLARWPFHAVSALLSDTGLPAPRRVEIVRDATDLMALPALALGGWLGR